MIYKNYLGSISKIEYDKIKSLSKEQLFDFLKLDILDDYLSYGEILGNNEIFELGEFIDTSDNKVFKPFFLRKELQDFFTKENEMDFLIVERSFLEKEIENKRQKIINNYKALLKPFLKKENDYKQLKEINKDFDVSKLSNEEKKALNDLILHAKDILTEWNFLSPYYLNEGEEITTSCKIEYEIFELVRIYKTFDWGNNVMVYYGFN